MKETNINLTDGEMIIKLLNKFNESCGLEPAIIFGALSFNEYEKRKNTIDINPFTIVYKSLLISPCAVLVTDVRNAQRLMKNEEEFLKNG